MKKIFSLVFLLACGTATKKAENLDVASVESCGLKISPSQKINIEYVVQQDYADDGTVNGSWNMDGKKADGIMVYNASAAAAEDYADDGTVNGSVAPKAVKSDRDDLTADAKDGKIDGIYCY